MQPLMANRKETTYLEAWKRILANDSVKVDCQSIFHLIQILLVILFTNAKVERMFSCMNCIKSDWRNRLNRDTLDDPSPEDFTPDIAIDKWFLDKVRRLKTRRMGNRSSVIYRQAADIAEYVLLDLESPSSDKDDS